MPRRLMRPEFVWLIEAGANGWFGNGREWPRRLTEYTNGPQLAGRFFS